MYSIDRIIKHINKKDQKPLNIIMDIFDEKYQYMLSKLHDSKNNFFIIPNREWNQQVRIMPVNFILLKTYNNRLLLDENLSYYAIIIGQNPSEYILNISTRFNCPVISVYTTLPPVEFDSFKVSRYAFAYSDYRVYSSEYTARTWMIDKNRDNIEIIERPIDTELFSNRNYNNLNNNMLIIKDETSDNEVIKYLTDKDHRSYWPSPVILKSDDPMLIKKLQNCSMVINTSWWDERSVVLEAMSVGCPIITTPCGILTNVIKYGINGYIAVTPEDFEICIDSLIKEHKRKDAMSRAARETILNRFDPAIFCDKWEGLLDHCSQASLGAWT